MYIDTNVLVYERWLVLKVRYKAGWPNAFAISYSHCLCMRVKKAEDTVLQITQLPIKKSIYYDITTVLKAKNRGFHNTFSNDHKSLF